MGEPQLGKRGLYPDLSTRYSGWQVREMMNLLAYSGGKLTLFEIAETIGAPFWRVEPLARMLLEAGLLRRLSPQPDYSITDRPAPVRSAVRPRAAGWRAATH
nr:winged helix-turn-helix domain-containing protein [Aeromonas dhakensis]